MAQIQGSLNASNAGIPIQGAAIKAHFWVDGRPSRVGPATATTNANGNFTIPFDLADIVNPTWPDPPPPPPINHVPPPSLVTVTLHVSLNGRPLPGSGGEIPSLENRDHAVKLLVDDAVLAEADRLAAYEVFGLVLDTAGRRLPDVDVRAFDRDYQRESVLGQASTDKSGRYRITFPATLHRKTNHEIGGPELFVRAFNAQGLMLGQSRTVPNAGPSTELNLTASDDLRSVSGTVVDETGRPLPGLRVCAFDRDLRQEEPLGQDMTDGQGRFQISYTAAQFRRVEKAIADLRVRVLSADGKSELATSATVFNAPAQAQVDLTIGADKLNTDSEWERYGRELAPLLGYGSTIQSPTQGNTQTRLPPHELTDEDLDFLNGETGIGLEHLRFIRQASIWWVEQMAHKLPAEALYGLLRKGMPADWAAMLRNAPSTWRAAIKEAIAERIVPAALGSQLDRIIAALTELAIDRQFEPPVDDSSARAPFGALIADSGIDSQVQRQIVALVLDKATNLLRQQIWPMLTEAGVAEDSVRRARFAMEAHELVGNHLPTVKALQSTVANGFGAGADLAQLSRTQWLVVAKAVVGKNSKDLPAGMTSAEAYAESLADSVELALPTAVVAHQLKRDNMAARQAVGQFLVQNPAFDLLHSSVEEFVAEAKFDGIQVPRDVLIKQLAAEVRMARMAPAKNRAVHMQSLHSNGFDSAVKVVMAGKGIFKGRVAKIAGAAAAEEMFSKAKARAGDLALYALGVRDLFLPGISGWRTPSPAPGSDLANWVDMFGSADGCFCPPCESVHGPGAYLMDLLQFLKEMQAREGSDATLFDVLMDHRPDLQHLKLNCANAETPLPYIDLVIEALEREIAGATADADSTPQTPESSPGEGDMAARLRALPMQQELTSALYTAGGPLLNKQYPWNLPFDRSFQQTAIDLELMGAPADEALALTVAPGNHLARARLGLDPTTWGLLHNTESGSAREVAAAWGIDELSIARLVHIAGRVGLLLARSGLAAEELFAFVESPLFAGWPLFVNRQPNPCNIDNAKIMVGSPVTGSRDLSAGELPAIFDLMHRCLRLRLQLRWPLARLQIVLQALGVGKGSPRIDLVELARLAELAARLGVSPEALAQRLLALQPAAPGSEELAHAEAAWMAMLELSPHEHNRLADLGLPNSLVPPTGQSRLATLENALSMLALLKSARLDSAELHYLLRDRDMTPAVFRPEEEQLDAWLDEIVKSMRDANSSQREDASADDAEAVRRTAAAQSLRDITGAAFAELVVAGDPGSPASVPPTSALAPLLDATTGDGAALDDFIALATSPPEPVGARSAAKLSLRRTLKTCRLLTSLGFVDTDVRALAHMRDEGRALFDFNSLPLEVGATEPTLASFLPLLKTSTTQAAMPKADQRLTELLANANDNANQAIARLEQATGWGRSISGQNSTTAPSSVLQTLTSAIGLDDVVLTTWQLPDSYASLLAAVSWLQTHRITAAPINELGTVLSAARQEVGADLPALRAVARSRFATAADWYKALTPATDLLRARQRDALVAHLLQYPTSRAVAQGWNSPDDIYEGLLIDVQMGPCQLSSRLVQAHGAVQLFVQRCLMNLMDASEVALGDTSNISQWRQWEWMKNYRAWEAARKVFLYPENWIEPDLRDVKSPAFEALENELLQGEITPDLVEHAVRNYLAKLHEVAKLDIRALYEEKYQEPGGDGKPIDRRVLHMVGRTAAEPPVYYYRKRHDNLSWTPWKKIDLSIDADHLVLAVHNRRPMLYWPTFKEVQIGREDPPVTAWDVTLNTSNFEFGTWSAPSSSRDAIRIGKEAAQRMSFRPRESTSTAGDVDILLYEYVQPTSGLQAGRLGVELARGGFRTSACDGRTALAKLAHPLIRLLPPGLAPMQQSLVEPRDGRSAPIPMRTMRDSSNELPVVMEDLPREVLLLAVGEVFMLGLFGIPPTYRWLAYAAFDDAQTPGLFETQVDDFRLLPCQQYPQFNFSQPYVLRYQDRQLLAIRHEWLTSTGARSDVERFIIESAEHAFVCDMLEAVRSEGLQGLYRSGEVRRRVPGSLPEQWEITAEREHRHPRQLTQADLGWALQPNPHLVAGPFPDAGFEFGQADALAIYNWEVFFHIPLLVADRLSKVQRFEEAQRWFHTIFDPTDVSPHPAPQKYWRVKPLFQLSKYWAEHGAAIETLEAMMRRLAQGAPDLETQVEAWRDDPFNPHLIARMRLVAYMKAVVRKYIENLIAWADDLFRRDTMESVNEATQLYVRGLEVLGPAPVTLPPVTRPSRSYAELSATDSVDAFSNVLVGMETGLPLSRDASSWAGRAAPSVHILYFCIPANGMLADLRAKITDRLFKLRNCMDIEGNLRQLALFAPPIDPALLVRARAAGLDLSKALSMALSTPSSVYRCQPLLQKALERCGDVCSFGAALLLALEKMDSEQLSQTRVRHESSILDLGLLTKRQQIKEAEANLDAATRSREVVRTRRDFFEANLNEGTSPGEQAQLSHLHTAHGFEVTSSTVNAVAAISHLLPEITIGVPPSVTFGGSNLGSWLSGMAQTLGLFAQQYSFEAAMSGYTASYDRRAKEWRHQIDTASRELSQIDQQIIAAEIRLAIAEQELRNHEQQVSHSREVENYLRDKFTNTQLYSWMTGQLATLHYQSYLMAFDLARQAEAAAVRELGPDEAATIRLDAWDGGRKGLLAGERLAQDLRRLELSYMRRNERRLEITTNISLRRLNPRALWNLRSSATTGEFPLPSWLFDMDFPGHIDRRIKSIGVSVPGVVGPYGGVNGMLSCTPAGYAGQAIIATSTGQHDAGVFQLDFRDERYLPFEGVELSGPSEPRDPPWTPAKWNFTLAGRESFDHDTISDLILHVQYTSKAGATSVSPVTIDEGLQPAILVSLRHDFPLEYRRLVEGASDAPLLRVDLDDRLFPYFARTRSITEVTQLPAGTLLGANAFLELAKADADSAFVVKYEVPAA
jgi:hypothetical protein